MPHVPSLGSIDYAGYSEHVCWGCGCSQCRCMNSKRTTSNSPVFDVIVVGAGASATAYQLFKNGAKRVLLLEQVLKTYFMLLKVVSPCCTGSYI